MFTQNWGKSRIFSFREVNLTSRLDIVFQKISAISKKRWSLHRGILLESFQFKGGRKLNIFSSKASLLRGRDIKVWVYGGKFNIWTRDCVPENISLKKRSLLIEVVFYIGSTQKENIFSLKASLFDRKRYKSVGL